MQSVSTAYQQSMKSLLRNRGYIQINFGIFNEQAQRSASFAEDPDNYIYYSNDTEVFNNQPSDFVYATLENHFFRVDGSQHFLPPRNQPNLVQNTGVISEDLVVNGNVVFEINLSAPQTWYGLTIDFGYNYPVAFDILYGENTLQVRNNTDGVYTADVAFTNVDTVLLVFRQMHETNTRARVYSVRFGIGYSFGNDDILDSSLSRVVSPISEFIPQFDFSVTLKNFDHYFDVDNPNSAINFLTTDNIVSVQYGYELDSGVIEWIPGQQLRCAEWESDDKSATIRCTDILRDLDAEFNGTSYDANGVSFGDLAETVLDAAGITEYTIDPSMYDISTPLPLPNASYKELLQMIANASQCVLTFDRDGKVVFSKITTNHYDFHMQKVDMLTYPKAIKKDLVKDITIKYASWFKNGTERNAISEETTVTVNEERTYHFTEPLYDYRVTVDGTDLSSVLIQDSGDYYLTLKFPSGGTITLDIYAKPYTVVPREYKHTIGTTGKSLVWDNPLVGSFLLAEPLVEWIGDFYSSTIEYSYDTRGNPELDVGDILWQDNEYVYLMKVYLSEYILNFRQSFSGQAVTHRIGGSS